MALPAYSGGTAWDSHPLRLAAGLSQFTGEYSKLKDLNSQLPTSNSQKESIEQRVEFLELSLSMDFHAIRSTGSSWELEVGSWELTVR
jgi:hypothetical protein